LLIKSNNEQVEGANKTDNPSEQPASEPVKGNVEVKHVEVDVSAPVIS
jgi:hypothetical protein